VERREKSVKKIFRWISRRPSSLEEGEREEGEGQWCCRTSIAQLSACMQ